MLDVNLNNTEPKHVERINPQITVDTSGNIVWVPSLLDYDASVFHRGKTVTNKEFNTLFLRQLYQGNYLTDSLSKFLTEHLSTAIHRKFTNTYKLVKSYIKVFTSEDWIPGEDGYSYITITAEEHGFIPIEDPTGKGMNIDTELYLLSSDGRFYEVDQLTTDPDNTVQLYTDDTDVVGFVVIRSNERSYAMSGSSINAEDINGLMPIARTALYKDLIGTPDLSGIVENAEAINKIIDGTTLIGKAQNANNVLDKIGNQAITDIFETGSSVVKQATNAKNYVSGGNIESTFNTLTQHMNTQDTLINQSVDKLRADVSDGTLQVKNSTEVNGLKIIRDANGVLKIGDIIIPQKRLLNGAEFTMPGNGEVSIPLNVDCSQPVKIKFEIAIETIVINFGDGDLETFYTDFMPYETTIRNYTLSDREFITYYRRMSAVGSLSQELREFCFASFTIDCMDNVLTISDLMITNTQDFSSGADLSRSLKIRNVYQIIE